VRYEDRQFRFQVEVLGSIFVMIWKLMFDRVDAGLFQGGKEYFRESNSRNCMHLLIGKILDWYFFCRLHQVPYLSQGFNYLVTVTVDGNIDLP